MISYLFSTMYFVVSRSLMLYTNFSEVMMSPKIITEIITKC